MGATQLSPPGLDSPLGTDPSAEAGHSPDSPDTDPSAAAEHPAESAPSGATFQSLNAGDQLENVHSVIRAPLGSTTLGMPSPLSPPQGDAVPGTKKGGFGSTMLGMPSPFTHDDPEEASAAGAAPGPSALAGTMIGMPSPFAQGPDGAEAAAMPKNGPPLTGTMMGMPSPLALKEPIGSPPLSGDAATQRIPAPPRNATMMGMAGPAGAPSPQQQNLATPNASSPPKTVAGLGLGEVLHVQGTDSADVGAKFKGTLLGIAQPGIAPTRTAPAPPAPFDGSSHHEETPYFPSYPGSVPPSLPPRRSAVGSTVIVLLGLLAAAAIGGLLAMLNKDPLAIVVQEFSVDEKGRDRLQLLCATCPDGSTLQLGKATAIVENEQVVFHPERPLSLGKNTLAFRLIDPTGEEREVAPLVLPIAFRVRTDWDKLHALPPSGRVIVEAPEKSRVVIDGTAVPIHQGRAEYRVELRDASAGPRATTEKVALSLPVQVHMDGNSKSARASLKSVVAPLTLSTVVAMHELGGKDVTLEGQTLPGASIVALDQKTEADAEGKFRVVLRTPSAQKVQVRALVPHLVARTVTLQLVSSLPEPAGALSDYAVLQRDGGVAALTATVLESRIIEGVTRALVDVEKGCPRGPCLARLIYPEPKELKEDSSITFLGVSTPGDPVTVHVQKFR